MRLLLLLLLMPAVLYGQGISNLWMMGYFSGFPSFGGVDIDFYSGSPVITHVSREMNFSTTSVSMCDSSGDLLFYSNGAYIANALGDTMINGSGLSPGYYTDATGWNGLFIPQAALVVPHPGNASRYYLFHGTIDDSVSYAYRLYYSDIDMSLDSGRGAVISKNNVLLNDTLIPGRITAVKHGNGRDWWVVVHEGKTENYYIFLVDPSGVHQGNQSIGTFRDSRHGQVCFSPQGDKFAYYDAVNDLDIMDFDRCTGRFSNPIHVSINDSAAGGGVAFSPSGRFLYVSSITRAYQFDMQAPNIPGSQLTVAVWDSTYSPSPPTATTFYQAQLAPDGKIYVSCGNSTLEIHVINFPDSLGLACDFCQHCIQLPAYNAFTMPNHPNYFLGADQGSLCDTLINTISVLQNEDARMTLFPNPVKALLYARTGIENVLEIGIYNSLGEKLEVSSVPVNNGEYIQINASSLASGVYFVEILTGRQRFVNRFVKE